MTYRGMHPPILSNDAGWEERLEAIPGISRLMDYDLPRLQQLLANCENTDSYLTSPLYYSFTGRKGLWVYEKNGAFLLLCRHPNLSGQMLIFPPLIADKANLVSSLLTVAPKPVGGIRIARLKTHPPAPYDFLNSGTCIFELKKCAETTLDWAYPVHLLSTHAVASLSGQKFMYIRNRLRQLKNHTTKILPFDALNHSKALENLLHRWATRHAANREEYDNLYSPYENLFSQSLEKSSNLAGQIIFIDEVLQAVALWDVSNAQQKTANLFVNICNTTVKGLSELLIVKSCEALSHQGIGYLNLGGSESEGLDAYKRKFRPAISIDLYSIDVESTAALQLSYAPTERKRYA